MSETEQIRSDVLRFCEGLGVDLGCGGDKITPTALGMDLPQPYTAVGTDMIELQGDARYLPFRNNALDYVYSSHLLEDFADTGFVLVEWVRVLKPGGYLVLYLPHEMRYRTHCERTGQGYNESHAQPDMSIEFIRKTVARFSLPLVEVWSIDPHGEYSFAIVYQKEHAR